MADIETTLDYYENLLIIQYNNKSKAKATIRALVSSALADGVYFDVRDGYDVETAIGVQLDVLGEWVGIDRFYTSNEFTDNYFGFADAFDLVGLSPNIVGFDDAFSQDKEGLYLDAFDVVSSNLRLNDDTFRTLIKLKIVQNSSNHSMGDISTKIYDFFDDTVLVKDNYDMTMTYFIGDTSNSLIEAALFKGVLPKPAGVRLQLIDGNKFFGFADAFNIPTELPSYVVGFNDAFDLDKIGNYFDAFDNLIT